MDIEVYKKSDFYEDYINSQKEYYERENADAYFAERLAEKDREIAELKQKLQDQCIHCPVKEQEDDVVAELKAKLENVQASAYAESVDAGMRERWLRRALWRAIALFCARSCEYFNGIMSHCLMGQDDLYKRCEENKNKYLNAMYKCRKKMEMYK